MYKINWTYIKHKRKDIVGISSLKMDGKLYCDPVTKSNILNRPSLRKHPIPLRNS